MCLPVDGFAPRPDRGPARRAHVSRPRPPPSIEARERMSKDSRDRVPGIPGSPVVRALVRNIAWSIAVAGLVVAAASTAAFAAWSPSGYPFNTAGGTQSSLRAVTDGRGG